MTRRTHTEGVLQDVRGRNGARDVVLVVKIPHGSGHHRLIDVPLEPSFLVALADAIRCCPQHVGERVPVETNDDGTIRYEWRDFVNLGHAIWHLENPDRVRPCLPANGVEIDVPDDDTLLPADKDGDS